MPERGQPTRKTRDSRAPRWDAVGTVITEEGTDYWEPVTEEEWAVVENGAMTIMEGANLLMIGILMLLV